MHSIEVNGKYNTAYAYEEIRGQKNQVQWRKKKWLAQHIFLDLHL